ncbi:hypothetical protein GF376_00785 [Candidatus Peregrinibacteria bacterium]|nr:hypothetical protein [Candidatus Peregrinibacteria bacterium]
MEKFETLQALLTLENGEEKNLRLTGKDDCKILINENAKLQLNLYLLSSIDLVIVLQGEQAILDLEIVDIGKNSSDHQCKVTTEHLSPYTTSKIIVKSVLYDQSRFNFSGNVKVPKIGQFTDAHLEHKTLLLSENAKTRTIPSMEIVANDVKVSHAATIGKIDEDILFYLASRGFDKNEAEKFIVESFLGEFRYIK